MADNASDPTAPDWSVSLVRRAFQRLVRPGAALSPVPLRRGRIPTLDGLRALAIALVLAAHLAKDESGSLGTWVAVFTAHGQLGVDLFFALSGYLITRLLLDEEAATGTLALGRFYARRALRILPPLYLFITTVGVLQCVGLLHLPAVAYFAAALFFYNYLSGDHGWWLGHAWSLSIEEQFYLLWPPLLRLLRPGGRVRLALGVVVLAPLFRLAVFALFPALRPQLVFALWTREDTLACGCALALAERTPALGRHVQRALDCGGGLAAPAVLLGSALLRQRFGWGYFLSAGLTVEALALTLLIAALARAPDGVAGRLLERPLLVHLGRLSYDLYLWQQLFTASANHTWTGRFPWNLAAALACAEVSYWLVGRPLQRLWRGRRPIREVAQAPG